jgi:hypothetical protein
MALAPGQDTGCGGGGGNGSAGPTGGTGSGVGNGSGGPTGGTGSGFGNGSVGGSEGPGIGGTVLIDHVIPRRPTGHAASVRPGRRLERKASAATAVFGGGSKGYARYMATTKQKEAARNNLDKARAAQGARAQGKDVPRTSPGMSTAEKDRLDDSTFAFPDERKEPLTDARHVRNAVARFGQVEGVTDAERDRAWQRIRAAARKHGVELAENEWRDLAHGGKGQ